MADFVAAIDQGTTSTRCMVFDHSGAEVGKAQLEHRQILPQAGWVEHDPLEIWQRTQTVVEQVMSELSLAASRSRRPRHHQPARDHGRLGPEHRPAVRQRHRLAGHPDG